MGNEKITIWYDKENEEIVLQVNDIGCTLEEREVKTVEGILTTFGVPYTEKLGNLLAESQLMMKEYRKDDLYQLGVQAGIHQMMDKIESQYERGKPVLANGKLYWMKNDIENLQDIMDDLENMSNEDNINGRK